jgi:hypothetical protein
MHTRPPNSIVGDRFEVAKFTPVRVTEKLKVVGPLFLAVIPYVTTGASYENAAGNSCGFPVTLTITPREDPEPFGRVHLIAVLVSQKLDAQFVEPIFAVEVPSVTPKLVPKIVITPPCDVGPLSGLICVTTGAL